MPSIGGKHIGSPAVMGILNVTPDSFSDGGSHRDVPDAIAHALRMVDEGAFIIDIGAESTRPGFSPIPIDEELSRLIPVIRGIREVSDIPISVDTMKPEVAFEAVSAGADILNDVNSFRDPRMYDCASETGIPIVLMHCPYDVHEVHHKDMTGDAIPQIREFFKERIEVAKGYGIKESDMILDPGIGFGKTAEQNTSIIERLDEIKMGHRVLVGLSRKRFLAHMYPGLDRDRATIEANLISISHGADIVRVHDVLSMTDAIRGCSYRE